MGGWGSREKLTRINTRVKNTMWKYGLSPPLSNSQAVTPNAHTSDFSENLLRRNASGAMYRIGLAPPATVQ